MAAGIGAVAGGAAHAENSLDMKFLYYGESDGRTKVYNPDVLFQWEVGEKGQLGVQLGYDSISGASPTGGAPTLDATTSASSGGSGTIPMVDYKDTRKAMSLSYGHRFGAHLPTVDLSYSKEDDYLSRGVSLVDEIRLPGGLTTLHVGAGIQRDHINPVLTQSEFRKESLSASVGMTRVLGARDLFDASFSLTQLDGYLTDPYKIVPVAASAVPEIRPDSRSRNSLVFKYGHYFLSRSALKTSYRYYWDDWSISAHTLETVWEKRLGEKWIVSPRVRYYRQGSASFFAYDFQAPERFMSADYRLSSFWSWLGGIGVRYQWTDQLAVDVSASYEKQTGLERVKPPSVPVPLTGTDEGEGDEGGGGGSSSLSAADLDTVMLSVGFSFRF